MTNLVMLGAVDQDIEATKVGHATDRVTLSIDKRQLNRMRYVGTTDKSISKTQMNQVRACLVPQRMSTVLRWR
jgi:hypothetical protein